MRRRRRGKNHTEWERAARLEKTNPSVHVVWQLPGRVISAARQRGRRRSCDCRQRMRRGSPGGGLLAGSDGERKRFYNICFPFYFLFFLVLVIAFCYAELLLTRMGRRQVSETMAYVLATKQKRASDGGLITNRPKKTTVAKQRQCDEKLTGPVMQRAKL